MPIDLTKEAKRRPEIAGDDGFKVSLHLMSDLKRKNDALKRALRLYKACREA